MILARAHNFLLLAEDAAMAACAPVRVYQHGSEYLIQVGTEPVPDGAVLLALVPPTGGVVALCCCGEAGRVCFVHPRVGSA